MVGNSVFEVEDSKETVDRFDYGNTAMNVLKIKTFGYFRMMDNKTSIKIKHLSEKERIFICFLMNAHGHVALNETIIDTLWPNCPSLKAGKNNYNSLIKRFREKNPNIDFSKFITNQNGLTYLSDFESDIYGFFKFSEKGEELLKKESIFDAEDCFRRALTLWDGPFMNQFEMPSQVVEMNRYIYSRCKRIISLWLDILLSKSSCTIDSDLNLIHQTISLVGATDDIELISNLYLINKRANRNAIAESLVDEYSKSLVVNGDSDKVDSDIKEIRRGVWTKSSMNKTTKP